MTLAALWAFFVGTFVALMTLITCTTMVAFCLIAWPVLVSAWETFVTHRSPT